MWKHAVAKHVDRISAILLLCGVNTIFRFFTHVLYNCKQN